MRSKKRVVSAISVTDLHNGKDHNMAASIIQQNGTIQWGMFSGIGINDATVGIFVPPILSFGPLINLADGRKQASLNLKVKANALVDKLDLIITANRAAFVPAVDAADVRVAEGDSQSIIVDFGIMLTVNSILINDDAKIVKAYPWLGTKFDFYPIVNRSEAEATNQASFTDVKTERLLITIADGKNASAVIDLLQLSLPDLPSGLTISINGDEPVWQHDPMVQLGADSTITEEGWNAEGKRRVSLSDAMAKYTQNPVNANELDFEFTLKTTVPGTLEIEQESIEQRHIHRLSFDNEKDLTLLFELEGKQELIIAPPADSNEPMTGIQLSISGELNPTRAIPAISSPANSITELVLGKGRAACVRLDGNLGLVELSGLRFPLVTGASGAEASVVLWLEQDDLSDGSPPFKSIEGAVSDPVNWTGTSEQWLRFDFSEAVALEENMTVWAAIHVNRGDVIWKVANANELNEYPIRIGPPEGPWRALPAIFGSSTSLGNIAGRVHLLGNADKTLPLPPLSISLDGGDSPMTFSPSQETSRVSIELDSLPTKSEDENLVLSIISRSEGDINISEVDVITGVKLS